MVWVISVFHNFRSVLLKISSLLSTNLKNPNLSKGLFLIYAMIRVVYYKQRSAFLPLFFLVIPISYQPKAEQLIQLMFLRPSKLTIDPGIP
ncbi:hypothetical protein EVA_07582 [gut metagenome]|uniref:Uncharacterized protein n=1 Tax=gut metagenome TaxID=749906 RepID=J9GBT8_9ZZZZ